MASVLVRNLSDETHRALKARASMNNRSTEAEIRAILDAAVRPAERLRLGTTIAETSRSLGLTNADVEAIERREHRDPAEPMRFD
ncbi:FitA-like ribbon-helix-helix domain-containing protein [Salinarimonas sp.]|uniref:FitA-like ribbon-helix-helix domain-containing protein n=1 Tax=Salinarimonas sp. TaxID=2766526 RepID=UPI00391D06DD